MGAWDKGGSRAWRSIRQQVLERDNYTCLVKVSPRCLGRANTVHHTVGRSVSGDDPAFLIAACVPCNLKIGNPNKRNKDPVGKSLTNWDAENGK